MTLTRIATRIAPFLLLVVAIYTVIMLITGALAYAQAAPPPPITVDTAAEMLRLQGPLWAGAIMVFLVGSALLTAYRSSSWLAVGKRLALATGLLGIAGAVLQWRVNGAPFEGVFAALAVAWGLYMTPTVTPPTPVA